MTVDNTPTPTPDAPVYDSPLAAAEARIAADDAPIDLPGAEAPPADPPAGEPVTPPAEPPAGDDPYADLDFENLKYEKGLELREELRKDRERWRPAVETLGSLSDQAREVLVNALPDLGDEAGAVVGIMSGLAPQDRAAVLSALDALQQGDLQTAAGIFGAFQQALSGQMPAQAPVAPTPPGQPPQAPAPDADVPLTQADVQRLVAEQLRDIEMQNAAQRQEQQMRAELTGLGYNPNSTDPAEQARVTALLTYAQQSGDLDLAKAHESMWKAIEDQAVAKFVAAARADAQRLTPASDTGTGPSPAREIKTIQDAHAAAEGRLAAAFDGS